MAQGQDAQEETLSQLIDSLTMTAVGAVERDKANAYVIARARTTDHVDRMRLDVDYWFPLVRELREAGRIPSTQEIRQKAESMVDMSPAEMRKVLHDYHYEVQQRKLNNA